MRIMIHSNAPWVPTGYGRQTAILAHDLTSRGHEVAISAFYGLSGDGFTWNDVRIFPAGMDSYGTDVLIPHASQFLADVVITLMDFWKLQPIASQLQDAPFVTAAWLPVDCSPLSHMDEATLRASNAVPVAMSQFGHEQLQRAGFDALYLPHRVTDMWPHDRAQARESLGLDGDTFAVGICSANRDAIRKAFPEQFEAFSLFHAKHPDSMLYVHAQAQSRGGLDLVALADSMGILPACRFSDTYAQTSGLFDRATLREWFSGIDVLSCTSMAEAFGVPILEAQYCGTPVIVSDVSAMPENAAPCMPKVKTERFWNPVHRSWWGRPKTQEIAKAYATVAAKDLHAQAKAFADGYDDPAHLDVLLENLEARCG